MCLDVRMSHVRKPIAELECFKTLRYNGRGVWATPYQDVPVVKRTGWFMPMRPSIRRAREYRNCEMVEGGYIHAYINPDLTAYPFCDVDKVYKTLPKRPSPGQCYKFACIARDVVAVGYNNDLVCRAIYIPAFDLTGQHRNAILDM